MRILAIAFVTILVVASAASAAPLLRESAVVDADVIRLGDLFEGVGNKADIAVAPAPGLGRRGIYDAAWLQAVTRANRIPWKPTSRFDRIIVERASQTLGANDIEIALKAAVAKARAQQGLRGKTEIDLDNRGIHIFVAPGTRPKIQVRDLWMDRESHRFAASLVVPSGNGAPVLTKVSGRLFEVTRIPALTRRMAPGEAVRKDDLRWIEVRADLIAPDTVATPKQILGLMPRRSIRPDAPLRQGNFRAPILVKKGSLVTIVLQARQMVLTVRGRATEDGAAGDVIKVINTRSHQTVDAVVDGPTQVVINTVMAAR